MMGMDKACDNCGIVMPTTALIETSRGPWADEVCPDCARKIDPNH